MYRVWNTLIFLKVLLLNVILILTAQEGNIGNCHPGKYWWPRQSRGCQWFSGDGNSTATLLCSQYFSSSTLCLFSEQSRLSEYMHAHFVYCTFKCSDYIVKHTRINYAQVILIFFGYHPSSSIFTCCQVPSHIRAWFHDSVGDNIYRYLWTGYEGVSKFMVSRDLNYDPTRSWGS